MNVLELENFYFEPEWIVPFDQLHEGIYISRVFEQLLALMGDDFYNYQFIYYASNGNSNPAKPILLTDPRPKVLIWSGDETSATPAYMTKHFVAIFKTFLDGDKNIPGYFHLPMGYTKSVEDRPVKPFEERNYNVFFAGNLNENRIGLYKALAKLSRLPDGVIYRMRNSKAKGLLPTDFSKAFPHSHIAFTSGFAKGFAKKEYSDFMYDSRMVICPTGFRSNETFRHYETWRTGGIPITLPLPDNHFYRGAPAITISSWRELSSTVKKLIKNEGELRALHKRSIDWWTNACSEESVAKYMRDIILRKA
jgi:hypothetical protein